LYYFIFGIVICLIFITYAKRHAVTEENYYTFFEL
jgi:hypothetical protein